MALDELDVTVTVVRGNTREVTHVFEAGRSSAPLSVGSRGDWAVTAPGVVPVHLWLEFDGRRLHAASGEASVQLKGVALGREWTPVDDGAELRFGFALLRVTCGSPRAPLKRAARARASGRSWRLPLLAAAGVLVLSLLGLLLALPRREPELRSTPVATSSAEAPSSAEPMALPVPEVAASQPAAAVSVLPLPIVVPAPVSEPLGAPVRGAETPDLPALLAPARAYPKNIADRPVPRIGAEPHQIAEEWLAQHDRQVRSAFRKVAKVIFLGDSITAGWGASPAYRASFRSYYPLNLGIPGDLTQNVLWRIQHGALDGTNARVIVLMIGINNLAGGFSPEQTAGGVRAIIEMAHSHAPAARIVLLSVLPARQDASNPLRQRVAETNRLLAGQAKANAVQVHDFGNLLLEPDGSISKQMMPDFLHPSPAAFERLSGAVAPLLSEIIGSGGK